MNKSTKKWILVVGIVAVLTAVVTGVAVVLLNNNDSDTSKELETLVLSPPSETPLGQYSSAAVSCDAAECAEIARDILKDGGSVADAAIGGLLCMGVIHSHSLGIGGGFLLTMYNATSGETKVLNARESAPAGAYKDMFEDHPENSTRGGLAVGIPGEVKGYWELHKKYGRLSWDRLFQPTIALCENGFKVTKSAASAMAGAKKFIIEESSLSEVYLNPKTQDVWKEGDIMTKVKLGETLRILATAENGGDAFYNGPMADALVRDIQSFGGNITLQDLKNYTVTWGDPIDLQIYGGFRLKTIPPPGSGVLLGFMLRVLSGHLPKPKSMNEYARSYQRIIETFKYTYAKRSILGDPEDEKIRPIVENLIKLLKSDEHARKTRNLLMDSQTNDTVEYYGAEFQEVPNNHGTAHISIIAANGDAISATSTINQHYGAKIRSKSTGIVLNNEMDDFSSPNVTNGYGLPPSVNNFIKPGKRPMSSMCPTIVTDDKGQVRLVVGAAGGTRITTATALVSIYNLWFDMNIKEAMDERRVHHQLFPMEITYEDKFTNEIIDILKSFGHKTHSPRDISAVAGVARTKNGSLQATFDFRKSGSIAGY